MRFLFSVSFFVCCFLCNYSYAVEYCSDGGGIVNSGNNSYLLYGTIVSAPGGCVANAPTAKAFTVGTFPTCSAGGYPASAYSYSYTVAQNTCSFGYQKYIATYSCYKTVTSSAQCPATCFDGIQNQGETGVDCGGPCSPCGPPPLPANCSDGVKSADETGIDCGGSCGPCTSYCPPGTNDWAVDSEGRTACAMTTTPDSFGNCPNGYLKTNTTICGANNCFGYGPNAPICAKEVASVDAASLNLVPPYTGSSGWVQFHGDNKDTATNSSSGPVTVVNPDNTSTTTTTTTTTSASGPTSGPATNTKTVTKIETVVKDSQDNVISQTVETQTQESGGVDASAYDWSSSELTGEGAQAQVGRFTDRFITFRNRLESASIYSPLKSIFSPSMSNRNPSYTINCGSMGDYTIRLDDYASAWSVMRYALIFLAMFIAARIIIVNK